MVALVLHCFFTMANVGPAGAQSGFVGEFLRIMGAFQVNTWVAAVAASGVSFRRLTRCGCNVAW